MTGKKQELAVVDNFQITTGMEEMDEELKQELADEMEDLDETHGITARQIKMPSGKIRVFALEDPDDPDNPETMKEIEAVILFTHRMNARWDNAFGTSEDGNHAPDCSAIDGKNGLEPATGEVRSCETCPYNAFQKGDDGVSRRACKNMRRIYMILSGRPDLYMLSVPPTSISSVNKQLARIMGSKRIPYTRTVVHFRLEKAVNKGGIEYSKLIVEQAGMLPPEMYTKTAEMRRQIKEQYTSVAVSDQDYEETTAPQPDIVDAPTESQIQPNENGFVQVEDNKDAMIPFN